MAIFTGKEPLEKYSCEIKLNNPVFVLDIPKMLNIAEDYCENLIAVRDNKVLMQDELIFDGDEIEIFIAVMGG